MVTKLPGNLVTNRGMVAERGEARTELILCVVGAAENVPVP